MVEVVGSNPIHLTNFYFSTKILSPLMVFPNNLNLNDFDYFLPQDRIALYPQKERNKSRLLVADARGNSIVHARFSDIHSFIPADSTLIINSTKVIPARFAMKKATGGEVELLCIAPISPSSDPQIAINAKNICRWECIVGGRNVSNGMTLTPLFSNDNVDFSAKIIERYDNIAVVEFSWNLAELCFRDILTVFGKIPLPPYIKRNIEQNDANRYQTVYANADGSVAAPTAGLHFTSEIFESLNKKNIKIHEIVLHIGPGTFVPISGEIHKHDMHYEKIFINIDFIENLAREYSKPNYFITVTGTTSLRTLETLYWTGVKVIKNDITLSNLNNIVLEQNYPYANDNSIDAGAAFGALATAMRANKMNILQCQTQLFIVPGYKIRTVNALITNFHLPKSTLLLLVSAFIGTKKCKDIYSAALAENYHFLSYGDASLLKNMIEKD